MWNYKFSVPENKKVRYIIHTDCKNEADDQFTVMHALMTDKLDVRGIVAGHFDMGNRGRFPAHKTAEASFAEVKKLLELSRLEGKYDVYLGAETPLDNENAPIVSAGAEFIINEAMRDDPRPLFIGMQGALTDLASAILMEPRICGRMTSIWVGGGDYPKGGEEFNLAQDIVAANVVFSSAMTVWQVPKSAYKQFAVSLAELQLKVEPCGEIGHYLFSQMAEFNLSCADFPDWPHGEIWGLGDEGCLYPLLVENERTDVYDLVEAPLINGDMTYSPHSGKLMRVYSRVEPRLILEDLFAKLRLNFG